MISSNILLGSNLGYVVCKTAFSLLGYPAAEVLHRNIIFVFIVLHRWCTEQTRRLDCATKLYRLFGEFVLQLDEHYSNRKGSLCLWQRLGNADVQKSQRTRYLSCKLCSLHCFAVVEKTK